MRAAPSEPDTAAMPFVEPADFTSFYRAHIRGIVSFFVRRTYDAEVAVDLAAETFARAFRARRGFRGNTPEQATAWLYTIAARLLSSYRRRGRAEQRAVQRLGLQISPLSEGDHHRIEELAGLAELSAAVRRELGRLPGPQQRALRLRVVGELSYAEVAEELQVSEQTARARVSRALRSLANSLTALHELVEQEAGP